MPILVFRKVVLTNAVGVLKREDDQVILCRRCSVTTSKRLRFDLREI